MKYVSLDLETTGLDRFNHVITEFAMVIDDLKNPRPVETLPAITAYVGHDGDLVWQLPAMIMFKDRLEEYSKAEKVCVKDVVARILSFLPAFMIDNFAKKSQDSAFNAVEELKKQKVTFAGKNFASFDKGFLSELPFSEDLMGIMHHRSIDVGTLYFDPKIDDVIPSTEECKKRAGLKGKVAHKALDDALDVVRLIRSKYKIAL